MVRYSQIVSRVRSRWLPRFNDSMGHQCFHNFVVIRRSRQAYNCAKAINWNPTVLFSTYITPPVSGNHPQLSNRHPAVLMFSTFVTVLAVQDDRYHLSPFDSSQTWRKLSELHNWICNPARAWPEGLLVEKHVDQELSLQNVNTHNNHEHSITLLCCSSTLKMISFLVFVDY